MVSAPLEGNPMGIFDFLKRKKVVGKTAVPAEPTTHTKAATADRATNGANATKAAASATPAKAQCAAITAAGTQCKSGSRENSKYCGRHKGYRATAKAPAAKQMNGSAPVKAGRGAKTAASTSQVTHGEYRLYQNGNRYFFSKKTQAEAKQSGAQPVYAMPEARTVVVTPNGLPVLKKQ